MLGMAPAQARALSILRLVENMIQTGGSTCNSTNTSGTYYRNRRISVFPWNINEIGLVPGQCHKTICIIPGSGNWPNQKQCLPSVTGSSCSFASLSSSGVAHLRTEVATANNGYDREAHAYT